MTQLLTLHQPCRLDLECPEGVPAPGPAERTVLKYMFSVRGKRALDLGCGCGVFGIAAAKLGAAEVWATDPSPKAVGFTRRNAEKNGVDLVAKMGDRFEAVEGRTFDLIVTLPAAEAYASILREAPEYLDRGGEVLTCLPLDVDMAPFESVLSEGFRFRRLPEERVEGSQVRFVRSYLAMKL
jgi:16S rRNA G1207 methylase RsmC